MFCKKCGKENDNDANFCIYCGDKLTAENMNTTIEYNKNSVEIKKNTNDKTNTPQRILDYFIIFGRWVFAIPFFVTAIGVLTEGAILPSLFIALCSITITPIKIPNLMGKNRFIVGFSSFLLAGFILVITTEDSTNHSTNHVKNQVVEQNKTEDIQNIDKKQDSAMLSNDKLPPLPKKIDVKIDDSNNKMNALYNPKVLDIIPTQKGKGWDKVLNQYGVKGVNKINELLPQAAEIMSKSAECDTLAYVAHSSRGTPQNIVIFGHCNNGARFYLSETDIKNKVSVVSNKTKFEQMQHQLEDACNEIIKSRLNHPQTFDKSFVNSNTYIGVNNIKITVGFTAKNSFNMKLKHTAVCFFNEKPELVEFTITEDK